jgi:hypothetical protein
MFTNRQVKENDFKEKDLAFRYLKSFSNFKGIVYGNCSSQPPLLIEELPQW